MGRIRVEIYDQPNKDGLFQDYFPTEEEKIKFEQFGMQNTYSDSEENLNNQNGNLEN